MLSVETVREVAMDAFQSANGRLPYKRPYQSGNAEHYLEHAAVLAARNDRHDAITASPFEVANSSTPIF